MASSEERLRELLVVKNERPLREDEKQEIQRIFELSTYDCMLCMLNDYSPSSCPLRQHSH